MLPLLSKEELMLMRQHTHLLILIPTMRSVPLALQYHQQC